MIQIIQPMKEGEKAGFLKADYFDLNSLKTFQGPRNPIRKGVHLRTQYLDHKEYEGFSHSNLCHQNI